MSILVGENYFNDHETCGLWAYHASAAPL